MFGLINGLKSLVFGGGEETVTQLADGQLFVRAPKSSKFVCLYLRASAEVQRSGTANQHTLVISRDLEDLVEDEEDVERTFLLDEAMNVYIATSQDDGSEDDDDPALYFKQVSDGSLFKFVVNRKDSENLAKFEKKLLQCMFERKSGVPADNVDPSDWLALRGSPVSAAAASSITSTPQKVAPKTAVEAPKTPVTPAQTNVAKTPAKTPAPTSSSSSSSSRATPQKAALPFVDNELEDPSHYDVVYTNTGNVFQFTLESLSFDVIAEDVTIALSKLKTGNFDYKLECTNKGKLIVAGKVGDSLSVRFLNANVHGLTISFMVNGSAFAILIKDEAQADAFVSKINKAIMEHNRQEAVTDDDEQYYQQRNVNYAAFGDDDDEDEEEEEEEEKDEGEEEEEEEQPTRKLRAGKLRYTVADEEPSYSSGKSGLTEFNRLQNAHNNQLVVGTSHRDRVFVLRGDKMGLFKTNDDNSLEYELTVNNLQTSSGQVLSPAKVMLHQQDATMIAVNPNDPRQISHIDVERGKVVADYNLYGELAAKDIAPISKYAQTTGESTYAAVANNAILKVDPRQSGLHKAAEGSIKVYSNPVNFTSIATTEKGEIVAGNKKGEVKLFNKYGAIAKTNLPGFGDPIVGVDVSADSKYILTTCKTYILVIPTVNPEDKTKTGFDKSLGQNKPKPIRLQLNPEHLALIGEYKVSFTPARFNIGEGSLEKTIVTSTGPYLITWNFRQVKKGQLDKYRIKKYSENVVANQLLYGQDHAIAVALPDDVTVTDAGVFSTPTKQQLRNKGHGVVNSPY